MCSNVFGAAEDFTTWTESDTPGRMTVTASKNDINLLDRDESAWLYDDKDAAHFSGDFSHQFEVTFQASTGSWSRVAVWGLANAVDDSYDLFGLGADFMTLSARENAGNYYLDLDVIENGSSLGPERSTALTTGTKYYVTIARDDDAGDNSKGEVVATIRTTSHTGDVVDTLTESELTEQNDFQYIYAGWSYNSGDNAEQMSVDIENLNLNEEAGGEPTVKGRVAIVNMN